MPVAYIGLGSNLGDREASIRRAVRQLRNELGWTFMRTSSLYGSPAADSPDGSPPYLNAVAEVDAQLSPREILKRLQRIEYEFGRERPSGVTNAPRTMDLDLLAYGSEVINEPDLEVPHPRMHDRLFVMAPLAELYPAWHHPTRQETAAALRDRLRRRGDVVTLDKTPVIGPSQLSEFDYVASLAGVAGVIVIAAMLLFAMFLIGPGFGAVAILLLLAWCLFGLFGISRSILVARRLSAATQLNQSEPAGSGFAVEATTPRRNGDPLDAEVVALFNEGRQDDREPASAPS